MPTSRLPVLLVAADDERRHGLARGLAELGYEVVPTVDGEEGRRFADRLGPVLIVADAGTPELADRTLLGQLSAPEGGRTLVLLGVGAIPEGEVPDEALLIGDASELGPTLFRKLRLVLLGREIGVSPDTRFEALVGDLTEVPPLELVRALARVGFTGRVRLEGGQIVFQAGRVVAASAGSSRGTKAFCRLGRRLEGPFRVSSESAVSPGEIDEGVASLVIRAVEDASAGPLPPLETRLEVPPGPAPPASCFKAEQRALLARARESATLGAVLDAEPRPDGEVLQDLFELRDAGCLVLEEPEMAVVVVTDSSADLPAEMARDLGIRVVPMALLFGEARYVDGVDLETRRFYELLAGKGARPATEPPTEEDFRRVYEELIGRSDVVSVHISGRLSRATLHARQAAHGVIQGHPGRRFDGRPRVLEVVDSANVSLGLGLLAVFAARMARRGEEAPAVVERLVSMSPRIHTLFAVDTLEYLARGGRIGKARAWLGELFRIKPILGIAGGEVVPLDRVRGGRATQPRILQRIAERVDPGRPLVVGVGHARAAVGADRLRRLIEERFEVLDLISTEIGPVVGTHAGPGTVGAVAFQPLEEEIPLVAPLGENLL